MAESIQARCPNCQAVLSVPANVAGKKIRCKKCETVFAVPGGVATARPAAPPAPGKARPVKPVAAVPPPPPPPAQASSKRKYEDDEDEGPDEYGVTRDLDDVPRCPHCAKELDPPDTKICLNCGYDLLERKRHESKKVYQLETMDYVKHFLPGVACLIVIILLITICIICYANMASWFEDSILEMDETDPNSGKKKYYVPPGFCTLWVIVPSLFVIWKCGVFCVKRFFINWRPPETVKKT